MLLVLLHIDLSRYLLIVYGLNKTPWNSASGLSKRNVSNNCVSEEFRFYTGDQICRLAAAGKKNFSQHTWRFCLCGYSKYHRKRKEGAVAIAGSGQGALVERMWGTPGMVGEKRRGPYGRKAQKWGQVEGFLFICQMFIYIQLSARESAKYYRVWVTKLER